MCSARSRRGFSILELVITLVILAVIVAIAVPWIAGARHRGELNEATRRLMGNVSVARALAAKGETNTAWNPGDRTINAGIRIISATQYAVFIDRNQDTDGDEIDVTIVDFDQSHPGSPVRLNPASGEIRFRQNGVLTTGAPFEITLQDSETNDSKTIRVATGGLAKLI